MLLSISPKAGIAIDEPLGSPSSVDASLLSLAAFLATVNDRPLLLTVVAVSLPIDDVRASAAPATPFKLRLAISEVCVVILL